MWGILDLWGISFHSVVVFGLDKDFVLKSVLEHCNNGSRLTIFRTCRMKPTLDRKEKTAHVLVFWKTDPEHAKFRVFKEKS